jgi:hypothetical protein
LDIYLFKKIILYNFYLIIIKKLNTINLALTGLIFVSFPLNFSANACLAIIYFCLIRLLHKKHEVEGKIFNTQIGKIYLAKNLKDVVLYFPSGDCYKTFDIKSFHLVSEQTFETNINIYAFPISHTRYNEYEPLYIPYNLKIYDREIFCAIFRGYPMKVQLKKEKNGYSEAEIGTS